jgi:undecaprenyl-diphosphatase
MSEYSVAVILGIIQGLTEFLPVSSTGHLIISSALLGLDGPRIDTFQVVIQLGSILAVVVLYWPRFWGLLLPKPGVRFAGARGLYLLFLTCLPAGLLGLLARDFIKGYLFNPLSVALALAVGACLMLLVEAKGRSVRYTALDEISPKMALGIGCCQCLSLWPGFSRSASTIMGGMLLGANRTLAVEYSFIAAVPIMVAATGYDLLKSISFLTRADIPFFLVGSVVSFLAALIAVKAFTGLVARISLRPFAVYRLALAPLVYWFFV